MNEFMPRIEIVPVSEVKERVIEVAQRLGRFLFTTPEVHPYMSEHFRPDYPPEPTDGEAYQPELPFTKEQTAAYYVAMAKQARLEE